MLTVPQTSARSVVMVPSDRCLTFRSIPLGESPPPPPRVCFGRDGLIKDIVGLAENHEPIALVGAAGIGKTSVALAVLHHNRIKDQFGDNRRFIRCDQFPPSRAYFLSRLSKAIGAGVDNPEDLTPLRSFLASTEMVLFLDTAESILDPQGAEAQGIYSIVEELSRFSNICLGITSRISTVPPNCKRPAIPMLTMDAARDVFYSICSNGERSAVINDLLRRLDFHALSITLLATTASHNMWDCDEVVAKWDVHRTQVLRTDFNESLAATIELSLASPTFQGLGPEARDLLGVIAFFPQGIDKRNLDWLFPTISDVGNTFDKFCVLSLTHRCGSFITMLAPIRDYLCPQDPKSSLFLSITKDHYFNRLLTGVHPNVPNFETTQWIMSEDVNVEHLLDVFTSVDTCSRDVWVACTNFMAHLYWHKPRLVILGPKIEGLPDNHGDKPECLFQLSRLFGSVGNFLERKRLLIHTLKLEGWQWGDSWVAGILRQLSDAKRLLHLREEGIMQAKEALGIFERLGNTIGQASCLSDLASLLYEDEQLDAAKEAAFRAIELLPAEREEYLMCRSHHLLGDVYYSKGEREKAIHHFEVALGIASLSNWHDRLFWIHYSLAELFLDEDEFDDAHVHIGEAKSHVIDDAYGTGRATSLQAEVWYHQGRLEEARFETSRAIAIFERLGATDDLEMGSELLRAIEDSGKAFGEPDFSGEYLLVFGLP